MSIHLNTKCAHLVLGTGPLGRATAMALETKGYSVILANRSGILNNNPNNIPIVALDLLSENIDSKLFDGISAIYFCVQPPYHRWQDSFYSLQEAAIKLAAEVGAKLIVAENLYGYGPVSEPMKECMALQPNTKKGRVRVAMHNTLMKAHSSHRVQIAVARGSDFYGPYVEGSVVGSRLFKAIIAGRPAEFYGDQDMLHSYTFIEDFGQAMAVLGNSSAALGEVWHVPNSKTVSTRTFIEHAFSLAGRKVRTKRLSIFELKVAGFFIPAARETIEMLYEFEKPFVLNSDKFIAQFGDISTPLESSLQKTIEWMSNRNV